MAGIRTIRDLNNDRQPDNARPMIQPQDENDTELAILGGGMQMGSPDGARKESFGYMCKFVCCPYFSWLSFSSVICIINVILFFVCVGYDYDSDKFLTPKKSTLVTFGATDF
jgi:hypothetical protein